MFDAQVIVQPDHKALEEIFAQPIQHDYKGFSMTTKNAVTAPKI